MTPMQIVVALSLVLIIGGLLICWLSGSAGRASTMFWWVGIVLAVFGFILLLAPAFVFLSGVIQQMLGAK